MSASSRGKWSVRKRKGKPKWRQHGRKILKAGKKR